MSDEYDKGICLVSFNMGLDSLIKKNSKWTHFRKFLIYIGNGAICGTETAKFTGCFYLEHILDTFGHFIGVIRIGACKK